MSDTDDLANRVTELEQRLAELERLIHDGQADDDITGMRELVSQIDPDTHYERALAIGYYLDQFQGYGNFTRADIEDGYRTCRIQKPANMSDILATLEDKEWVMRDGKDGQSQLRRLTQSGLNKMEGVIDDGS